MLKEIKNKSFTNGVVYLLKTDDNFFIETTDTFLPYYTKDAIGRNQNCLTDYNVGSRNERWMIGVSVQSGCPIHCKFCATGKMKKFRNLSVDEIIQQVLFVLHKNEIKFDKEYGCYHINSKEFKINYTRMGEPFLNIENVKEAIEVIDGLIDIDVHHYISTIGIKGSDFSWIKGNITLQLSVHSFDEEYRDWLIPFKNKMTLEELGKIRTNSNLKTTVNLTLVRENDFDIEKLKQYFDPKYFLIKLSPINKNEISDKNDLGNGIIESVNLI